MSEDIIKGGAFCQCMDKTLIVCGSAGRGGVTEMMCQMAADVIRAKGYDSIVVYPSDMRIEHCRGCDRCSEGRCIIDDDMHKLYRLFADSDFLILATPLHFSGPSSLIKTVMDRFQAYWFGKDLPHPKAAAGMICAGSEKPNFEPTIAIMRAFAITTDMKWLGQLEFAGTDVRGDTGADEEVARFIGDIFALGDSLPRAVRVPPDRYGGE